MNEPTKAQTPTERTDSRSRRHRGAAARSRGAARLPVLVAAGLAVVAAAVVVPLVLTRDHHHPADKTPPAGCGPLGCSATVNVVHRSPRVTVFFGRSCPGLHGSWFLNAVEGGGSSVVRVEYYLKWTLPPGS